MIVVDASIVANAVGDDEAGGNVARAALSSAGAIAAPHLVDVETTSVLRKRWLAGDLSARRFRAAVEAMVDLPMVRHPHAPFMARAYELRGNVTPYDAVYVALAEELGCELVTGDRRLAFVPGPRCAIRVIGP